MSVEKLKKAKINKKDEFYTQMDTIQNTLKNYIPYFKNKKILCNCDDPRYSNFFKYFANNFINFKIKSLTATSYKKQKKELFDTKKYEKPVYIHCENIEDIKNLNYKHLEGDGDFRSSESLYFLNKADLIVTNPPFSQFINYIHLLIKYNKKFIVIGNINAIAVNSIFTYMKIGKLWLDTEPLSRNNMLFEIPKIYSLYSKNSGIIKENKIYVNLGNCRWFTNIKINKNKKILKLKELYNPKKYFKFYFYNIINIDRIKNIPKDYKGAMGVPITFMDHYNEEQFEILNVNDFRINNRIPIREGYLLKDGYYTQIDKNNPFFKNGVYSKRKENGKSTYARIVIKNKKL